MACPAHTALGRKIDRVGWCEDPNLSLLLLTFHTVPLDHTAFFSVRPLGKPLTVSVSTSVR